MTGQCLMVKKSMIIYSAPYNSGKKQLDKPAC